MSLRSLGLDERLRDYLIWTSVDEHEVCRACREQTASREDARMQISAEQGQLMDWLVRLLGVRRAVEVGTFTGYSALRTALAMPADGRLTCCDIDPETGAVARSWWAQAGVSNRVELRIGPAADTLRALIAAGEAGTVDMMFVDADKEQYAVYVDLAWELLRPGGVLLVDNVLWSGRVVDEQDAEPSTVAIRALNRSLRDDPRWDRVMIPIGDGLYCLRRR